VNGYNQQRGGVSGDVPQTGLRATRNTNPYQGQLGVANTRNDSLREASGLSRSGYDANPWSMLTSQYLSQFSPGDYQPTQNTDGTWNTDGLMHTLFPHLFNA
jgi:hypothetical protein